MLVIEAFKKDEIELAKIPCIHYPIWFKKDKIWILVNFGNEVNTITLVYTA